MRIWWWICAATSVMLFSQLSPVHILLIIFNSSSAIYSTHVPGRLVAMVGKSYNLCACIMAFLCHYSWLQSLNYQEEKVTWIKMQTRSGEVESMTCTKTSLLPNVSCERKSPCRVMCDCILFNEKRQLR